VEARRSLLIRCACAAQLVALSVFLFHSEAAAVVRFKRPVCEPSSFRTVVDVGHTVEKPGARSARGVGEYEFNLRLATLVEQKLRDAGFDKTVLLVTIEAPRAGLFKRAAYANGLPADLFLSIHHDSVPDRFLEKWEYEGEQRSFSDRFKGHAIFVSRDNGARKGSLLFAKLLGQQLKDRDLLYTRHYTDPIMGSRKRELLDASAGVYSYDELIVLKETRMPAVLLEAGSIINRDEELAMASPERQALISDAITDAVKAFCKSRAPRRRVPARKT
jgi:N-acetylmuramoyl-L-alanine amidase